MTSAFEQGAKEKAERCRAWGLPLGQRSPTWQKGQLPVDGADRPWKLCRTSPRRPCSSASSLSRRLEQGHMEGQCQEGTRCRLSFAPVHQSTFTAKPKAQSGELLPFQWEGLQSHVTEDTVQGE